MAKVTFTKWQCDCCGALYDEKPAPMGLEVFLTYKMDFGVAGHGVSYSDNCASCNMFLEKEIEKLHQKILNRRQRASEPPPMAEPLQ